jgi:hypothetical protein
MGIYPTILFTDERGRALSLEGASYRDEYWVTRTEPGLKTTRRYTMVQETVVRDDCFCCSCGEREGSDASCRNHGNGLAGERPCEVHKMPGAVDDDGEMPESVQARNARRRK